MIVPGSSVFWERRNRDRMIVRCWLPLHEACRRHPPAAALTLAAAGALGVAGLVEFPVAREPAVLAAVALVLQIHAVALQLAAVAVLVPTLALAAALGADSDGLLWLAAASALLLGPAVDALRRPLPGTINHVSGRAAAILGLGSQFVVIAAITAPELLASVALLLVLGAGVLPAATLPHPALGHSGPFHLAPAPGRWWALAGVALVAIDIVLPQPVTIGETGWFAWLAPLVWLGLAQRPWPVIGAILASIAVAMRHGPHAMDADVLLGHLPPLLLWLAREPQRGIRAPGLIAACALLAAMALAHPRWGSAALLGGLMILWITLGPHLRPLHNGSLEGRARRAVHRQPPSWRWYHFAKWRSDPVYRQLVDDPRHWGHVLDLGCGSGLATAIAALRPDTTGYLGVDLDHDKLHLAAAWLDDLGAAPERFHLLHASAPLDPEPSQRFDTILLLDVLHYWPLVHQQELLLQAAHLLAPQGRIILRDAVADAAGTTGAVGAGERFTTWLGLNPRQPLHFLDEPTWQTLLTACGLREVSQTASGGANRLRMLERV